LPSRSIRNVVMFRRAGGVGTNDHAASAP